MTGIIADVRERGDAALCEYTQRFDGFELTPDSMRLTAEEIGTSRFGGGARHAR